VRYSNVKFAKRSGREGGGAFLDGRVGNTVVSGQLQGPADLPQGEEIPEAHWLRPRSSPDALEGIKPLALDGNGNPSPRSSCPKSGHKNNKNKGADF
jgi:hypothetical protein